MISRADDLAPAPRTVDPVGRTRRVPPLPALAHGDCAHDDSHQGLPDVRLTVTDIDASRAFYDAIFGLPTALKVPEDADEATWEQRGFLYGGVIYQLGDTLLGLRAAADDVFSKKRVGLDHVAFTVEERRVLDDAARQLDDRPVTHTGGKEIGAGYILEFRDPDGIALELFAPKA